MSLRITVVPASTNAGRETIRALLNSSVDPIVHGVYRDVSKVPTEFTKNENFIATTGDVSTGIGLDFMGSDAVLYIPPPPATGSDLDEFATRTANNVKKALSTAPSVKRLLLFSSMGAQYDREIGILRLNHLSNRILEQAAAEVLIIKPGLFHELWAHVFETTKDDPPVIYSTISPSDHKVPMVSVTDVGVVCAEKLLETGQDIPSSPHSFDLYGPRNYSSEDIKAAVEDILQKEIQLVTIPPEGLAEFYSSRGYPKDQVPWSVEMTTAALPGGIMAGDFEGNEHTIWAKQELVTSLRKMYEAQRAT